MKSLFLLIFTLMLCSVSTYAQSKKKQIQLLEERLERANQHIRELNEEFGDTHELIRSNDSTVRASKRLLYLSEKENETLRKIMREYITMIDSLNTLCLELNPTRIDDHTQVPDPATLRNELGEDDIMPFYSNSEDYYKTPPPSEWSEEEKDRYAGTPVYTRDVVQHFEQLPMYVPEDCVIELELYIDQDGNIKRARHIRLRSTTTNREIIKVVISHARKTVKFSKVGGTFDERQTYVVKLKKNLGGNNGSHE